MRPHLKRRFPPHIQPQHRGATSALHASRRRDRRDRDDCSSASSRNAQPPKPRHSRMTGQSRRPGTRGQGMSRERWMALFFAHRLRMLPDRPVSRLRATRRERAPTESRSSSARSCSPPAEHCKRHRVPRARLRPAGTGGVLGRSDPVRRHPVLQRHDLPGAAHIPVGLQLQPARVAPGRTRLDLLPGLRRDRLSRLGTRTAGDPRAASQGGGNRRLTCSAASSSGSLRSPATSFPPPARCSTWRPQTGTPRSEPHASWPARWPRYSPAAPASRPGYGAYTSSNTPLSATYIGSHNTPSRATLASCTASWALHRARTRSRAPKSSGCSRPLSHPGVYRSVEPAWNDENLRELAGHISSPLFFTHIRAAIGSAVQQTNCQARHRVHEARRAEVSCWPAGVEHGPAAPRPLSMTSDRGATSARRERDRVRASAVHKIVTTGPSVSERL